MRGAFCETKLSYVNERRFERWVLNLLDSRMDFRRRKKKTASCCSRRSHLWLLFGDFCFPVVLVMKKKNKRNVGEHEKIRRKMKMLHTSSFFLDFFLEKNSFQIQSQPLI